MANITDMYKAEISNFLKTVTIYFRPMSVIVGDYLNTYVDTSLDTTSVDYYHSRLTGSYIPGDTPMYVTSTDTGESILFNKQNLEVHPRTAAIYRVPNIEYDTLCKKYPEQLDLIKSIVYSASVPNNTEQVLQYVSGDISLLQRNESYSIIEAIQRYCKVVSERWWVKEYCYEIGYPIALYSMFWQHLPLICMTKRMTNIKTGSAHHQHVWDYLMSKGLADYRDILTTKQAMFLYRNINYILANKGTADNLLVLSDNIISDFNITLYGKQLYQQQTSRFDECRRTPEVVSVPIVSYDTAAHQYENISESMSAINSRMFQKGIERINTISYVEEIERQYGEVEEDRLPTKLVELKKDPVNSSHKHLFLQFILETLVYRLVNNKLSYTVSFRDTLTDTMVQLHAVDAFLIMYYAIHKSCNTTPVYTPKYHLVRIPYKLKKPSIEEFHKHVYINDIPYDVDNHIHLNKLMADIPWNDSVSKTRVEFSTLIYEQFSAMLKHFYRLQNSAELLDHRCMMVAYHQLCMYGNLEKELTLHKTYEAYINSFETVPYLLEAYDNYGSTSMYSQLATSLLQSIIDFGDPKFKSFAGATDSYSNQFETMTSLLIQLSSHNITFLGTAREGADCIYMTPFVCHTDNIYGTSTGVLDINTMIKLRSHDHITTKGKLYLDTDISKQYEEIILSDTIYLSDLSIDSVETVTTSDHLRIVNDLKITYGD